MEYSMAEVIKKTGLSNRFLQNWLFRYPSLIKFSGGGKPGQHRRFPLATVAQLAVAKLLRESSTFPVERALQIGQAFADYRDDVRIHDEVVMIVTKNDVLIGPRGHRRLTDDGGFPIGGIYFLLTDLHRELFGPHKPRDPETPNQRRVRLGFSLDIETFSAEGIRS